MSSISAQSNKKRKLEDISNKKTPAIQQKSVKSHPTSNKNAQSAKFEKQSSSARQSSNQRQRSSSKSNIGQKSGKKLLNEETKIQMEEEKDQEIEMTQSQVIIGNMFSLYALAEKQPQKIKMIIDQIFSHQDKSEEFIVKTMFLYFLELIGFSEIETLSYNANFIAKNSDETKLLSIFQQDDKFEISFEKLVFFSQEKKALEQKKLLKRVCKIFISNVVDLLPDKASYLEAITKRVCIFSKSHQRLIRYAFSYIGLYMFKFLLDQFGSLLSLKKGYEEKHKNELSNKQSKEAKETKIRIDSIQQAIDEISLSIETIRKHLILKRNQDTQVIVRKSIYEFFLQLDEREIEKAFILQNEKDQQLLMDGLFDGLKDEDNSIKKISLQIVHQLLTKFDADKQASKSLKASLIKYKTMLFGLANMSEKNQDTSMAVKALQIITKTIKLIPDLFSQDLQQSLKNLVHSQNMGIREEAGDLILTLSDEFDDQSSLLELQKLNPLKGIPEKFVLNFQEEPNKSQKQLLKLIKMFQKNVQTGAQLLTMNGRIDQNSEIQVANLSKDDLQRRIECEHEERAILLFQTYQRKTSVLFDVQSITNILKKEDIDHSIKLVLVNLMKISLIYTDAMKNLKDQGNLVFNKIQESQQAYLKLTVMNELIQTHRVDTKILEPLLSCLLTLSKNLEKDQLNDLNNELGKDIIVLLLKIIENTTIDEKHPETYQIVHKSVLNLAQLQTHFPQISKQLIELGQDYCDKMKQEIVPRLFSSDRQIDNEHLSFLSKLNVIISQIKIKQIADVEYLKEICSFVMVDYSQMILNHFNLVSKLHENQFKVLIQLPFTFIDQLLGDSQNHTQYIQYQQKMLNCLMEFYLEMHTQYKKEEQLQVVILRYIVELIVVASGENRNIKGNFVQNLNDFPRVKELLTDLILSVSGRLKGNEYVVQEQFKIILTLFMRDFNSLISEVGVEFLINFGTSKDSFISKEIRKLYYTYKQRDRLLDSKKGIFYSFVLKILVAIYNQQDAKIYRLQEQAPGDIKKEMIQLGLDDFEPTLNLEKYSKLVFINSFIKTFLNSIMLLVISNKPANVPGANGLSKQQDEYAYFKLVEGIIRISLQDKANLPMLYIVKYFMHKNFLNQMQQEGVLKGLKLHSESQKENLNFDDNEKKFLEITLQHISDKITLKQGAAAGQKKINESSIMLDKTIIPAEENANDQNSEQQNEEMALKAVNEEISKHKDMIGKKRKQSSATTVKKQGAKIEQEEQSGNKKIKKTK